MGQAFDDKGGVLGEASGATKREVFDELIEKHPDAHEIRVRSGAPQRTNVDIALEESGEQLLKFFGYAHLPPALQGASLMFADLAIEIVRSIPRNPERTVALRKLLEAKDCAVRALLP